MKSDHQQKKAELMAAETALTLHTALSRLIALTQAAEAGKGMTLTALREVAEEAIPLLSGPERDWHAEREQAQAARLVALAHLREYRSLRARGYWHEWLIDDAIKALEEADG